MKYEISNEYLKVKADTEGAILWSVTDKDGFEYIWQGDDRYWNEHGANLFPYIARLWEKSYIFQGKTYHMDIHGFAKDSVFSCEKAGRMNWCLQWKIPGKLWNSIHFIFVLRSDICLRKIL